MARFVQTTHAPASRLPSFAWVCVVFVQCKELRDVQADESAALTHLNFFGCRMLGAGALRALLDACGNSVQILDLNGTIKTADVTETALRHLPQLRELDLCGRVAKR